jgi:2,4'-dihydroxyacetophenone dioxygenase
MITLFHVTGAYIYVDPDGNPVGVEDVSARSLLQPEARARPTKHFESLAEGAFTRDFGGRRLLYLL